MRRGLTGLFLGVLGLTLTSFVAVADEFPSRPVRIIVPNPPGGSGDVIARLISGPLTEAWHQPVVIENQPGASGAIGMNMVRRSAPDGYTLGIVLSTSQIIDRIQNKAASFQLISDFTPVIAVAKNPVLLISNTETPYTSVQSVLDQARKDPGSVLYSSPGIGTAHHLNMEVLARTAGVKLVNVPYKGTIPALNDVIGNHVAIGIVSLSTTLPHIESGKIRGLLTFDRQRNPRLPNVPAVTEVFPNFELVRSWLGIVGPPGIPAAVTARLNGEIARILKSDDSRKILEASGLDVIAESSAEFADMIREDIPLADKAANLAGLYE